MAKTPWMSLWLSEANRAASASRSLISAEIARQQTAMTKAWTKQATEMWMAMWFPWMAKKRKK